MAAITGAKLRAEREAAGVLAIDVAGVWFVDPAIITRLEQGVAVKPARAQRYRRAVQVLAKQRQAARRELIRELATLR